MSEVRDLHLRAMVLVDEATHARQAGQNERAREVLLDAFRAEREAALRLAPRTDLEPTRSVLLRSAAALAMECGEMRSAESLIAHGLAGDPPDEIADELRDLLDEVNFRRHLQLRGVSLADNEVQFAVAGDAVGHGTVLTDEFVSRVQVAEKIIYRTAERQSGLPFRERGAPRRQIRSDYELFMSTPRAASYAVTFKLGRTEQLALPGGLRSPADVIDELMKCLNMYNRSDEEGLERHIGNDIYYRNFLGLVQQMAPDGAAIKLVGLTTIRDGQQNYIEITRPRPIRRSTNTPSARRRQRGPVTVVGELRYADSMPKAAGSSSDDVIRLLDSSGAVHRIRVPQGMMTDIVRPLWEDRVAVTGTRQRGVIHLDDIRRADEEDE